jgi:hypothetical protein
MITTNTLYNMMMHNSSGKCFLSLPIVPSNHFKFYSIWQGVHTVTEEWHQTWYGRVQNQLNNYIFPMRSLWIHYPLTFNVIHDHHRKIYRSVIGTFVKWLGNVFCFLLIRTVWEYLCCNSLCIFCFFLFVMNEW